MKNFFLFSMMLIPAAQAVDAQNLVMSDRLSGGALEVIPKEVTKDNRTYMAVYNFREEKEKSELMIALSREEIIANLTISNSPSPHDYWMKNSGGGWVEDNEHTTYYHYHQEYENALLAFLYQDPDNSFYPTSGVAISQNIFNSDDNWEYVMLDVEINEKEMIYEDYWWDGVKSKYVEQVKNIKGFKIMNQTGNQIAYIPIAELKNPNKVIEEVHGYALVRIGSLLYMTTMEVVRRIDDQRIEDATGMYVFDTSTSRVVSSMRSTNRISVNGGSGTYNVKVENARDDEKVIITDMSGRTVGSASAKDGIFFQSNGSKIVNITLSADKVEENIKFMGE
ncbi:MAG: hypothetical protein J5732_06945 [Bacteroidaceae bacterium]|nr:hypothetical protein [Bacteroidaceae bacterium]